MKEYAKMLIASIAMLLVHFQAVSAANITYSLTTHVDGRTITATANSISGSLLDNMPQKLWRGYTSYKFYSDAELTQEITTVPEENTTVYVDYVFEPPFAVSDEGLTIYYTLRGNYANGHDYYFYGEGTAVDAIINDYNQLSNPDQGMWAYYGDGYSLNFKNKHTGTWLSWNNNKTKPVLQNDPLSVGWQLYNTDWTKDGIEYFALFIPTANDVYTNTSDVLGLSDMSGTTAIMHPGGHGHQSIDPNSHFDDHAVLIHNHEKISWCVFYGTQTPGAENVWHVEYIVYHEYSTNVDHYFYDKDLVDRYVDYYFDHQESYLTYEYYHDEEMTQEWLPGDDNDMIPPRPNTVVYVKEILPEKQEYITDHWITLVLPYNVDDLAGFFGTTSDGVTPAVRVQEYISMDMEKYPYYTLNFTPVDKMEANKPYLFKADEILADKYLPLTMGPTADFTGNEADLITLEFNDAGSTRPDVYISMTGTYDGMTLSPTTMAPDENGEVDYIYFYFGYNPDYDPESPSYVGEEAAAGKLPYNFHRVRSAVDMPKNRCYFKIYSKDANAGVNISRLGFESGDITGISESVTDSKNKGGDVKGGKDGIFNLNGSRINVSFSDRLSKGMFIVNGKKTIIK